MLQLYKLLLHLYPSSFRNEYGAEMCRIFSRGEQSALSAIADVVRNAAAVHWDILRQDLRYAARTLGRSRGFALTAVLVVALGVGANTAVFSIADHVFLRPLPFSHPERLVALMENRPEYNRLELSPANYRDWKKAATSFEDMGIYSDHAANLVGHGTPERLEISNVSASLFPVLGVSPMMGRAFTEDDDRDGGPRTVILSYSLWQSLFAGDPAIIGGKILLDDAPYSVIGVMPRQFVFPTREVELWTPFQFSPDIYQDRNNNYLRAVARLKPQVTIDSARAEMEVITRQLEQQYPKENAKDRASVFALRDEVSDQSRMLLWALGGAAVCVLLIACANLANLLLARALSREKELAVRTAMGAGRERLARQMITESLLLAFVGGALGTVIAVTTVPLLARLVPTSLPIGEAPPADLRMFGVAAIVTLITGIGFGLLPALRAGGVDVHGLRDGARAGSSARKSRLRNSLVMAEVAMSVVLLVSCGLLMRALWHVQSVDPGFRSAGVLTMRTDLPWPRYAAVAKRAAFYNRVLSGALQIPGVSSAAFISFLPMVMRGGIWSVEIDGRTLDPNDRHSASMRFVTPGFFQTLSIPLRQGRDVSDADTMQTQLVAVVSQSFADRYWPGENPIGRQIQFAVKTRTIVGIVGDVRVRGLERSSEPQVYLPYRQVDDGWFTFYAPKDLAVRSSLPTASLAPQMRELIREADPEQPVSAVRSMSEIVDAETAPRALQVRVVAAFAAVAFLLAAVGIHGVLSFAVSQRTSEIGVRIVLGAQPSDILSMILRQGVLLAFAGLIPGVALAYVAGRSMQALLAGVRPADAEAFAVAVVLCSTMTIAGSLLPAWRALRIDPLAAIRAES